MLNEIINTESLVHCWLPVSGKYSNDFSGFLGVLHFSTCKFFLLAQTQSRVGFRNRKSHSAWGKKKKNFFSSTIITRYWEMKTRVNSLPCQQTAHTAPALMHLLRLRHNHVAGQSCSSASLFCEDAFASKWVPSGGVSYLLISVKCSLFPSVFLFAFDLLAHPSNYNKGSLGSLVIA